MKYAGGCFGCLTLILMATVILLSVGSGAIVSAIMQQDPQAGASIATLLAPMTWVSEGCCCLSGILAVVFLAIGMSKKDESSGE